MKINSCETVVEVNVECESCGETFTQTYSHGDEDAAYVSALMMNCPCCGKQGLDRETANREIFG